MSAPLPLPPQPQPPSKPRWQLFLTTLRRKMTLRYFAPPPLTSPPPKKKTFFPTSTFSPSKMRARLTEREAGGEEEGGASFISQSGFCFFSRVTDPVYNFREDRERNGRSFSLFRFWGTDGPPPPPKKAAVLVFRFL